MAIWADLLRSTSFPLLVKRIARWVVTLEFNSLGLTPSKSHRL